MLRRQTLTAVGDSWRPSLIEARVAKVVSGCVTAPPFTPLTAALAMLNAGNSKFGNFISSLRTLLL